VPARHRRRAPPLFSFNLFWRTFFLLAVLLVGGVVAWVQTLRQLEFEPRAVQAAQQIASLVNLSRAAMQTVDSINRIALVKTMRDQESVRVLPREPQDRWEPYDVDAFTRRISDELHAKLGTGTIVARAVNGKSSLWVGFTIDTDNYWLQAEPTGVRALTNSTWFVWVGIAFLATLLGSAAIAGLINRPLQALSEAATRIANGDFDTRLDEGTPTTEIRDVNAGFNRMARELAKVDQDRTVMLAGISHDLRTPLARLRLETEISVPDEDAKRHMADDIEQLDAIIDKFMDYARPAGPKLEPVALAAVIEREAIAFRDASQIRIVLQLTPQARVNGDPIELGRVFSNLFENARRYGRTVEHGIAEVHVRQIQAGNWVVVTVRDHGPGVPPDKLAMLTTPFFRNDTARTAATGAGLGLAIVKKSIQRLGGTLEMTNAPDGGLVAHIRLRRTDAAPTA
jgi:two-component system osmolarity sensor histidine kinase EnvZ